MKELFSSLLGTAFFTAIVFVVGAFIGRPIWDWISPKLPWNKK